MFLLKRLCKNQMLKKSILHFLKSQPITYQQYLEAKTEKAFFENFSKSSSIKDLQETKLDDQVTLYGIPFSLENQSDENLFSQIKNLLSTEKEETNSNCLIHLDPSLHLYKKRKLYSFLNDKFVYKGIIETKDDFLKENPCKLRHPNECLLEPAIIDYETQMKYMQKNGKEVKDFFEKNTELSISTEENRDKFLESLTEVIHENLEFTDNRTNYEALTQIILHNHMKEKNIYFCDIPAVYHRMVLAKALSLEKLIVYFKEALTIMKNNPENLTLQSISSVFMGTILETTRFFYIRSLKEEMEKMDKIKKKFSIFLRMDSFLTFQKYYEVEGLEHSWEKAFNVPMKTEEPDERLIEKHALLDFMMESNLWNRNYIGNPFPYISENFHSLSEEDMKELKKKFYVNFKKFEKIKTEFLK